MFKESGNRITGNEWQRKEFILSDERCLQYTVTVYHTLLRLEEYAGGLLIHSTTYIQSMLL